MKLLAIGTWDPRETNIPRCSLQSTGELRRLRQPQRSPRAARRRQIRSATDPVLDDYSLPP
jgi:hypothetical protein